MWRCQFAALRHDGIYHFRVPCHGPRMTQTVSMPLWAFILIVLFAAVTFASHFLFPSVRWFFRKRAERVIARVNERLQRPIEPFKLARRYDMIQRLIYDPEVTQAIVEHAQSQRVPENVAFESAQRYAREIVPSFSATAYFSVGIRIARFLSKSLYRVRIGTLDSQRLSEIDPDATVVFVMNHRSNMDYVLVTYLAANASALSYAVGEWARVWPLSSIIRAMGAYFIRRRSRGALYRKVLARYVQLSTQGGVTQAMFPEGGLSLTGSTAEAKLGLLSYIIEAFDPEKRDVIFVPVALNYDRVLEDRFLIAADKSGKRRFRPPLWTVLRGVSGHLWDRLTRKFKGFGTASVSFGSPVALSSFATGDDTTEKVAAALMSRIAAVIPVLGVPLIARELLAHGPLSREDLQARFVETVAMLRERQIARPRRKPDEVIEEALAQLTYRALVEERDGMIHVVTAEEDVLRFYANSIAHHFDAVAENSSG